MQTQIKLNEFRANIELIIKHFCVCVSLSCRTKKNIHKNEYHIICAELK